MVPAPVLAFLQGLRPCAAKAARACLTDVGGDGEGHLPLKHGHSMAEDCGAPPKIVVHDQPLPFGGTIVPLEPHHKEALDRLVDPRVGAVVCRVAARVVQEEHPVWAEEVPLENVHEEPLRRGIMVAIQYHQVEGRATEIIHGHIRCALLDGPVEAAKRDHLTDVDGVNGGRARALHRLEQRPGGEATEPAEFERTIDACGAREREEQQRLVVLHGSGHMLAAALQPDMSERIEEAALQRVGTNARRLRPRGSVNRNMPARQRSGDEREGFHDH